MEEIVPIAALIYIIRAAAYGGIGDDRLCGFMKPFLAAALCGPIIGDILAAVIILASEKRPPPPK